MTPNSETQSHLHWCTAAVCFAQCAVPRFADFELVGRAAAADGSVAAAADSAAAAAVANLLKLGFDAHEQPSDVNE